MKPDDDQSRAQFEQWVLSTFPLIRDPDLRRTVHTTGQWVYPEARIQARWETWCKSREYMELATETPTDNPADPKHSGDKGLDFEGLSEQKTTGLPVDDLLISEINNHAVDYDYVYNASMDIQWVSLGDIMGILGRWHRHTKQEAPVVKPDDDPMTAFLTELKALMEKYDAAVEVSKIGDLDVTMGPWRQPVGLSMDAEKLGYILM